MSDACGLENHVDESGIHGQKSLKLGRPPQYISVNPRKDNTMQTTKSAPATNNKDLKEAFALWEKKGAKGVYYSGKTSDPEPVNIVGFITTEKKNEKQPDLRVYVSTDKDAEKIELAALWKQESKAGKTYYSGYSNEKEKLIAFINGDTKDGKYPSIRVYFKQDTK